MARTTRKELLKDDEFMEAAFDFGHWLEQHWKTVVRVGVGLLVVAIAVSLFLTWRSSRLSAAEKAVAAGSDHFNRASMSQFVDTDALASALEEFEKAESMAGSHAPGPLATYYRGVTLYRLGRNDEAVEALESFVKGGDDGNPLEWAGRSLLAELLAAKGETERAVGVLQPVVDAKGSGMPRDQALYQIGEIHAAAGDRTAARTAWEKLVDEMPDSVAAGEARAKMREAS